MILVSLLLLAINQMIFLCIKFDLTNSYVSQVVSATYYNCQDTRCNCIREATKALTLRQTSDIIVIRRHVNYASGYKCQYDRQSAVVSAGLTRRSVKVKSLVCLNQCARKRPSYLCPIITRTSFSLFSSPLYSASLSSDIFPYAISALLTLTLDLFAQTSTALLRKNCFASPLKIPYEKYEVFSL